MSARRTPSTTSLSKYARSQATEEGLANRSLDFCNAFWGIADGGYDVLLTRVRGAVRTTEELRAFWKERAAIEDDYAKRMSKLAKQPLGRDEIGELRNSLDTLRLETDRQATSHANLAKLMRKDLEQPITELLSKQAQFKKVSQTPIEKSFKAKQTQESYVKKARQKYEDDCVRINSFTAQSTLVQGRDLERVQQKLEKAKQTVQANEREFSQFARALADTTSRWEKEWKVFCDGCQDLEDERIEFIKDNMWAYANAVSTVCVSDDESCEVLRVALEQVEPDKDVENFVRDYATGPQIPDPPTFVDYNTLEAGQQPSRPSWRPANFARSTNRAVGIPLKQPSPAEEEVVTAGHAGIGAGGGRSETGTNSRPASAAANKVASTTTTGGPSTGSNPSVNGGGQVTSSAPRNGAIAVQQGVSKQGQPLTSSTGPSHPPSIPPAVSGPAKGSSPAFRPQNQDPHAEPIDPRADTMLKVGPNTYKVNLSEDPQQGRAAPSESVGSNIGEQDDPLAKQAAALRDASVRRGNDRPSNGSVRRGPNDIVQNPATGLNSSAPVASGSGSSRPTMSSDISQAGGKNYQAQADSLIGGPPPPAARTASPNPPTASFMIPPGNRAPSPVLVEEVVSTYQQHFPGERKSLSISRQNSVSSGREGAQNAITPSGSAAMPRPVSREGHVGIGAHGGSRSPSPQPVPRPVSPTFVSTTQSQQHRRLSYHTSSMQQGPLRPTTPLGIAIDATGRVAQDSLAEQLYQNQQQVPQRRISYYVSHGLPSGPPPGPPPQAPQPPQQAYDPLTGPGEVRGMYSQPPQQRQYPQPPPPQAPPPQPQQAPVRQPTTSQFYNPHAPQNPPRQSTMDSMYNPYPPMSAQPAQPPAGVPLSQPQYPAQQPPQQSQFYPDQPQHQSRRAYGGYNQHGQALNGYQQGVHPDRASHAYGQPPQSYQAPTVERSPSPAAPINPPTGQYTEDGQGVLFYVKALYDYQATIDEEFDFQAGDVIAVTATPEDGWWSGMLLDEMRRVPGKTIFPSNFVSLF